MPKVFTSKSQKTGEIGEHIAVRYLSRKGFSIVERNYTKKWGEIDIIARKKKVLHFVEVKSKTGKLATGADPEGTYRPEDQVHAWKIKRLRRTIETYLAENKVKGEWVFDLVVIYLSEDLKEANIRFLENLII